MLRSSLGLVAWFVTLVARAATPPEIVHVLDVTTGWEYAASPDQPTIERLPDTWQPVKLPHRPDGETNSFYRATFAVPAAWAGSRVSLVLRPIGGTAWVWLNGTPLGVRSPSALNIRLDCSAACRPGARNTLLVGLSPVAESQAAGLAACRLEATGAVSIQRITVTPSCLAQGAVVDVALEAANAGSERFEGKLELGLEAPAEGKQPARAWRRGNDVRLDPGQVAAVAHSFEPEPTRLWRHEDPFLYPLTATLQTRDGEALGAVVRRVGLRSIAASQGRWLVNGEWMRLAAIAVTAPGATLLCTQPGQAAALSMKLASGQEPPLDELLAFCDQEGILAFLDAPAATPETPGWSNTLAALAAEGAHHPCVWGWIIGGDAEAFPSTLARLRELTPRLPIGRPTPCTAAEAKEFDFLVSRFATKAGREDDDAYGRRLDDLVRDASGKPAIAIDRVGETTDTGRADASLAHRLREVGRRSAIAILAFEVEPDETLLAAAEKRLNPFRLSPPSHEARLDRENFVIRTRFEVQLASPVAQRLPCYSLAGYRIAWVASRGDTLLAAGTVPLSAAQPRAVEGGCQPGRAEAEWQLVGGGATQERGAVPREETVDFAAELHTPSGRTLVRHAARLLLKAKDSKAELSVQSPDSVIRNP